MGDSSTIRAAGIEDPTNHELIVRFVDTLADLIRLRRKWLAFTQLDVAASAGSATASSSIWNAANRRVQLSNVLEVLDLLGLELVARPREHRKL